MINDKNMEITEINSFLSAIYSKYSEETILELIQEFNIQSIYELIDKLKEFDKIYTRLNNCSVN